jgi:NADH-quinone oxidoreductase subunit L
VFAVIGSMMTAYYMFRLFFLTFGGSFRGIHRMKEHIHEAPLVMFVPLVTLAALSVLGGWINCPESMGGSMALQNYLDPVFAASKPLLPGPGTQLNFFNDWSLLGITLLLILGMVILAYYRFIVKAKVPAPDGQPRSFVAKVLENKFYIDELYGLLIERPLMWCSRFFHEFIEIRFIDRIVNGFGTVIVWTGNTVRFIQTGHVGFYLFMMVFGIIAVLFFNIWIF